MCNIKCQPLYLCKIRFIALQLCVTFIRCSPLYQCKIRFIALPQPGSQGFSVRTRRDTRKPWSGPVNFAFWLTNTILSKNNWTWQLTITIQHLYFYDSCVYEYVLQNNLSKQDVFPTAWFTFALAGYKTQKPCRCDVSWQNKKRLQLFKLYL